MPCASTVAPSATTAAVVTSDHGLFRRGGWPCFSSGCAARRPWGAVAGPCGDAERVYRAGRGAGGCVRGTGRRRVPVGLMRAPSSPPPPHRSGGMFGRAACRHGRCVSARAECGAGWGPGWGRGAACSPLDCGRNGEASRDRGSHSLRSLDPRLRSRRPSALAALRSCPRFLPNAQAAGRKGLHLDVGLTRAPSPPDGRAACLDGLRVSEGGVRGGV
jgi:hypothetical protein